MSARVRPTSFLWLLVPFGALLLLAVFDVRRARHVEVVSAQPGWYADPPTVDAASPTGYSRGGRRLVVPEHNNDSFHWIAQAQQALRDGSWRVRRVESENAPFGRETQASSLYRLRLLAVAGIDRVVTGRAWPLAVEHAALYVEPLFQLLLLGLLTAVAAWKLGRWAASVLAAGWVALFPLAGAFPPGMPSDRGLALVLALASAFCVVIGLRAADAGAAGRARRWFVVAGFAGGIGLWVNLGAVGPVVLGIAVGGGLGALRRKAGAAAASEPQPTYPWRWWGWAGGAASLAGYALEYAPGPYALHLEVVHPLYSLAWVGVAELIHGAETAFGERRGLSAGRVLAGAAGLAAVLPLPIAMLLTRSGGFWGADVSALRLSFLPDVGNVTAPSLWSWLGAPHRAAVAFATLAPLLLALPAAGMLVRGRTDSALRWLTVLATLTTVVLLWSCLRLRTWELADGLLLLLLAASVAGKPDTVGVGRKVAAVGLLLLAALPGLVLLSPTRAADELSESEVEALIERDVAGWLSRKAEAPGEVVLAPPDLSASAAFYGGFRGIGSLYWENYDGISATFALARAISWDEARALLRRRQVRWVLLPSWDLFLDESSGAGTGRSARSFVSALRRLDLPPWVQPVAYLVPRVGELEPKGVQVFRVLSETEEEPGEALAASRLAEYALEMERRDLAAGLREKLRSYTADVGAEIALAQIAATEGDATGFQTVLSDLVSLAEAGAEGELPFDRRVNLAIVLAHGKRADLARVQLQRCLAEIDAPRLRELSTGTLFRMLTLAKREGLGVSDPQLRELAASLLPPALRARL